MPFGAIVKLLILSSIIPTAIPTATEHPASYQVGLNVEELTRQNLHSSVVSLTNYRAIIRSMENKKLQSTALQIGNHYNTLKEHYDGLRSKYQILKANNHPRTQDVKEDLKYYARELQILEKCFEMLIQKKHTLSHKEQTTISIYIKILQQWHQDLLTGTNYKDPFKTLQIQNQATTLQTKLWW